MAFEPIEDQDDAGALPRRFAFPLEDEDADGQNELSIGQRIMQLVPTRVVPDEPRPLRGVDVQQPIDNKPQVETKPSIGRRIVQLGRQGLPPFDIQDGRPVWRQDPQSLAKPNIGQRIMGLVPNWKLQPTPMPNDGLGWWSAQIKPLPNSKSSEIHEPEPIPNFNPTDSTRMEQLLNTQAGINYPLRSLQSTPTSAIGGNGAEWQPKFVDGPLSSTARTFSTGTASSGSWNKSSPSFGGTQENLKKPLDFNEFASFLGGRQQGNSAPGDENYFTPSSTPAAQTETRSVAEALGKSAGAALGTAGSGGLTATVSAAARHSVRQKPPAKGSVGKGGENDPARVKVIQRLLNEAIDLGHLSGSPLEENGQVSDAMLRLLENYQRTHKLHQELVTENSLTEKDLKQNPFEDTRWDGHDETIKGEVDSFNKSLKQKYPAFPGLDWRLVKAMLWQESGGPNTGKEWEIWPMQIGRRKADLAIQDVMSGGRFTNLIAPKAMRDEIANAYRQHKMTPTLNIRAGVIFLCAVAISGLAAERDTPKLQGSLEKGQTLSDFAEKHGTTVETLRALNPKVKGKERLLREGTQLTYQETKPVWSPWQRAVHNYNSETTAPNYGKNMQRYYGAIKKRWSENSIVREH